MIATRLPKNIPCIALLRPNKMAAATEAFVNAVEAALANAEVEMVNNRGDEEKIRSVVQEVRSLLRPVAIRHFDTRRGFKHKIGDFYSMLKRQAMGWMQHLQQRMSPRCSIKQPWQVVMAVSYTHLTLPTICSV